MFFHARGIASKICIYLKKFHARPTGRGSRENTPAFDETMLVEKIANKIDVQTFFNREISDFDFNVIP